MSSQDVLLGNLCLCKKKIMFHYLRPFTLITFHLLYYNKAKYYIFSTFKSKYQAFGTTDFVKTNSLLTLQGGIQHEHL